MDEMKALALRIGVSSSAIYSWVRGEPRKSPTTKNFLKLKNELSDGNITVNAEKKSKEKEKPNTYNWQPAEKPNPPAQAPFQLQLPPAIVERVMVAITDTIIDLPGTVRELHQDIKEMKNMIAELKKSKPHHCPECHGS